MTSENLSGVSDLLGVPSVAASEPGISDTLPDLVVNRDADIYDDEVTNTVAIDPGNIEGDLEAADILLSLSDARNDTLDDDDNSQLMPVGIPSNVVDAAPVPLQLDQVNVDSAIADLIQTEELENPDKDKTVTDQNIADNVDAQGTTGEQDETTMNEDGQPKSTSPTQGSLKIKTHTLKKKTGHKRNYKCMVCGVVKPTMQLINKHHIQSHKAQPCPVCGRIFALASSRIRHMYDHDEHKYKCELCDYSSHFESELTAHKIVHRKNPSFQCMVKNCGKWFHRK